MATTETDQKAAARASVLENIGQMEKELTDALARNSQLERDLQTANDRVTIMATDRHKYQEESKLYRGKMIELATAMANISLLTDKAREIMLSVSELEGRAKKPPSQPQLPPGEAAQAAVEEALKGVAVERQGDGQAG